MQTELFVEKKNVYGNDLIYPRCETSEKFAYLLNVNTKQTIKALGLAALQTSGLMAWEDDPKEDDIVTFSGYPEKHCAEYGVSEEKNRVIIVATYI